MLNTRNYDKWLAKQNWKHASMRGWNENSGELRLNRRKAHFFTKGLGYVRKSFGRRPHPTFGRGKISTT